MSVLVTGSTSQIGRFLLPRLVRAGEQVDALSRRPQPVQPGVRWIEGGMAALPPPVAGQWSAIASFSPLEAWVAWLSQQSVAPAAKIIATSSMSVLTKQASAQADEQDVVAMLQRGEQGLIAQAQRLGMQWVLLRPTLIYGAGIDRSLSPIVARARRLRVFPLPVAGGQRQPVHADDIALAVLRAVQSPAADGQVLEIGGGERLRYDQMFARVHASLVPRPMGVVVPGLALRVLSSLVPRARGPVSRLEQDLVADNGPLQSLLGVQPRPFRPENATWQPMTPEQAQQRIQAASGPVPAA
ncbi:NAD-dependent epimerase/dehydratase family protein [Stenotrophomonas sp. 24(2023)]|uniref:NAD-dependent epimerase/dehydratase family protein n=1 Tax=Stenotrophomonas sp. 24(2023) TaxID=3068324 RepID=UPI0027E05AA6|nr:NAD-dependent epimerase/dehydratase family protein [Stenotrophomonas sp. 24(2023)]WMJ70209.1 hypothetical protein Q9R17_03630 [Stenotrophomonas sp. 24(2023)]